MAASWAADQQSCEAAAGSYRSGAVVNSPKFAHGQYRRGIELSHTHIRLLAEQDGRIYDVAIDNVFANGYDPRQGGMPAQFSGIRPNDRIEVCGQLYTRGVGVHFVHTNCGASPTAAHPDGWIRLVARNGSVGANLEANTAACGLFGRRR